MAHPQSVPESEQTTLLREMLLELKAIRLGIQALLETDEDLLELAHEEEIPA